ncbi:MAG: hypothetical protein COB01_02225 [Lutibacter sp.]|nr:MAG: hypothetical protein COB01_02225 [Lutibacter sp.]
MLKELSKYENLGTPSYHFELLNKLRDNQEENWKINDIVGLFHNRIIDGRSLFDGCLPFLNHINIVQITPEEEVIIDSSFLEYLVSESLMVDRLIERLLLTLNSDPIFHDIFCSEFISRDIIYHSVQIDNSAFPLKHSNFKQLIIDFGILQEHPTKEFNKFIINGRYKKIFDKVVLPEIKKRKIGVDELRRSLEQKQIHGEEAEIFVLKFESERLNGKKEIDWVAEYSAADGYDIASYESEESTDHNRFIEVKSYIGKPYFFWSRNEIDIARIKKLSYYLYLVDRKSMNELGYAPIIIQDPYNTVLKNESEWDQRIEKIKMTIKNKD